MQLTRPCLCKLLKYRRTLYSFIRNKTILTAASDTRLRASRPEVRHSLTVIINMTVSKAYSEWSKAKIRGTAPL